MVFYRDAAEIEERPARQIGRSREHLIETYRKKAKHYDITSRLYPAPGYPSGHNVFGSYKHSAWLRVTA